MAKTLMKARGNQQDLRENIFLAGLKNLYSVRLPHGTPRSVYKRVRVFVEHALDGAVCRPVRCNARISAGLSAQGGLLVARCKTAIGFNGRSCTFESSTACGARLTEEALSISCLVLRVMHRPGREQIFVSAIMTRSSQAASTSSAQPSTPPVLQPTFPPLPLRV